MNENQLICNLLLQDFKNTFLISSKIKKINTTMKKKRININKTQKKEN